MKLVSAIILAIRPKTLTAALVPVVVAAAVSYRYWNVFNWKVLVLVLIGALSIQIATNFFNDAVDFKKGADTEERLGPVRVTQSGQMSARQVMSLGLIFCLVALVAGIPLVMIGGWPIVVIGVVSLLMAYSYTGGPFPLAYLGLGDLFVILFFGLIAVMGTGYLLTQLTSLEFLVAGLQVGFLSTTLIAINNARDREQDIKVNKRTLAVRFGVNWVKKEIVTLYVLTLLLGLYWVFNNSYFAAVLPLLAVPIIVRLSGALIKTAPGVAYNQFLARSAMIQIVVCSLLSIGLLIDRWVVTL